MNNVDNGKTIEEVINVSGNRYPHYSQGSTAQQLVFFIKILLIWIIS